MKYAVLFLSLFFFIACKNDVKKEVTTLPKTETETTTNETVKALENPSAENSQLPRLYSSGNELYFSWVTRKDSIDQLYYSAYINQSWQTPMLVAQGDNWFTNWADFPAIAFNDETVLTSHLQKSADSTYTYDVMLNLFDKSLPSPNTLEKDGKRQFVKENFILHNDGTQSEHGFVSMLRYQDNSFFITWLDGRNTGGGHGSGGAMTLRGAVVPATGEVAQRTELDNKVCDCCQTSAAMTSKGPIVAYRDRSDDEVRDISVVRHVNGVWTTPKTIGEDNWKIAGCPVNGPSIDAKGDDVAIAWFTANKGEGDVKVIFSEDAGETYTPAYRIDAGSATGRVDIVMLENKEAAVIWMQPKGEQEMLYLMKVNKDGYTSSPIVISETSSDRASGFPQLERLGDDLVVAWTDTKNEQSTIKMTKVALDALVIPTGEHHSM